MSLAGGALVRATIVGVLLFLSTILAACGQGPKGRLPLEGDLRVKQALSDYETAQRRGDVLDLCVKAKFVRIAYEDAGNTTNMEAWRARERETCAMALAAVRRQPESGETAPESEHR